MRLAAAGALEPCSDDADGCWSAIDVLPASKASALCMLRHGAMTIWRCRGDPRSHVGIPASRQNKRAVRTSAGGPGAPVSLRPSTLRQRAALQAPAAQTAIRREARAAATRPASRAGTPQRRRRLRSPPAGARAPAASARAALPHFAGHCILCGAVHRSRQWQRQACTPSARKRLLVRCCTPLPSPRHPLFPCRRQQAATCGSQQRGTVIVCCSCS